MSKKGLKKRKKTINLWKFGSLKTSPLSKKKKKK